MYVRQRQAIKRKIISIESQLEDLIKGSYRIDRDGISQSLMSNWTCRVKFCLACQRWSTPDKGKNTYYGSMVHDICEAMYKARTMFTDKQMDEVIDKYITKNRQDLLIWTDGNIEQAAAIVKTVMLLYCEIYESDFSKIKILQVEEKFVRKLQNKYIIRGKIDLVFSYLSNLNSATLMEHKSMGTVNENVLKSRLPIDKQNLFYLTALLDNPWNIPVNEVLYNIIRRPQIKKSDKEGILDFCNRLKQDIISRPDFYFLRYTVPYRQEDILKYRENLIAKFDEINSFTKGEMKMYRNESSCESAYNGTPFICEYIPVCQSGELRGFIQQKSLFPELED